MRTTIDQLYSDIWHYVFESFNTTELFLSFVNITPVANEVLFNDNSNFYFRGLRLDSSAELTLPEKLPFCRIHSLEIHQGTTLDIIRKCSALRSVKVIGRSEWIISLLTQISSENMQLERLIIVASGIGPLQVILRLAGSMWSLRQLEVFADEIEENIRINNLLLNETRIESFTLHSSSSVHWNDLLNMLPALSNVHFLNVTLFQESKNYPPFKFCKLRHIRLMLLEISFYSLVQLVTTTPFLSKLKLTGLIDAEGYVVNPKWISLFDFRPSIDIIRVNLSLEEGEDNFRKEVTLAALYEINLKLICLDDECDYYVNESNRQRWWKLSGVLNRHHLSGK